MKKKRPDVGSVVRIDLPDDRVAFGRVLRDAAIAVYRGRFDKADLPPLGQRDYEFVVGIYDADLGTLAVVGLDPGDEEDLWPPPWSVAPILPGDSWRIYHHGAMRPATVDEARFLEPAAAWTLGLILDRLRWPLQRVTFTSAD